MSYHKKTTDELLALLPTHLHVARNDKAPRHDRWRIYNRFTQGFCSTGESSVHNLLVTVLMEIEDENNKEIEN